MLEANLTVKEVAIRFGNTLTHVYNMVRTERLPGAFKTDGEWRVPQATVNAYLKKRQQRIGSTPHDEQMKAAA